MIDRDSKARMNATIDMLRINRARGRCGLLLSVLRSAFVSLFLLGCGGDKPEIERVEVSGQVTYQGEPVENGRIRFAPTGETNGPVSGGAIHDGEYAVTAKGGVPIGVHRVEITAFEKLDIPEKMQEGAAAGTSDDEELSEQLAPKRQLLPSRFNTNTQLQVTIPTDDTVTKDFHLK